ncbi:MAG: lysophospholipid acyltransferase family protein [Bdellovibrionales bacterium]
MIPANMSIKLPLKRHAANRAAIIPRYGSKLVGTARIAGFLLLVAGLIPSYYAMRIFRPNATYAISLAFHRLVMRLLGFHVRVHGDRTTSTPTLYVSNHVSYLDIHVLGSVIPASFIAKSEVAKWPLMGYLAKMQKTVFIERRAGRAANQRDELRDVLEQGGCLILFPEGTSTHGHEVRPFKSSLFSAVSAPLPNGEAITVQPVSIACTEMDGIPVTRAFRSLYAWYGDMTMFGHLWNVFKCGNFTVDVVFHPPISTKDLNDRKTLAALSQSAVTQGLERCLTGRMTTEAPSGQKVKTTQQQEKPRKNAKNHKNVLNRH